MPKIKTSALALFGIVSLASCLLLAQTQRPGEYPRGEKPSPMMNCFVTSNIDTFINITHGLELAVPVTRGQPEFDFDIGIAGGLQRRRHPAEFRELLMTVRGPASRQ